MVGRDRKTWGQQDRGTDVGRERGKELETDRHVSSGCRGRYRDGRNQEVERETGRQAGRQKCRKEAERHSDMGRRHGETES